MQSTIAFGRCHLMKDEALALALLKQIVMKYYPCEELVSEEIAHAGKAAQRFEIEIEHLSGKEVQKK